MCQVIKITDSISHLHQTSTACRPSNSTRGTFSSLGADLRCYQLASLAEGKIKTYSSGEKQFTNFYYQFHLHKHVPLLQTMENILIYFAVFLAKMVTPDTIKVDLATVRHMHLVNSYNLRITKFQCLHYILRGIKWVKGVSTRTCLQISLDHLKLFHHILHSQTSPTHDETMIWAAISIVFLGFCSCLSTNLFWWDVSIHNEKRGIKRFFCNYKLKDKKPICFEPQPP